MKIAVTYDRENDSIFQHFGHTEAFKIFEVEDGGIAGEEVIDTAGTGHEALAGFLANRDIDVLICGGMGQGAKDALDAAGIEVISGIDGNANQAVAAYMMGELVSAGVNCDHHHDHSHGDGDDCNCGDDCGGCGGGCGGCGGGAPQIIYDGPNSGKVCKVHYVGTFNDGTQFDSSYDRGEPLQFICGIGMMIPGFDKTVANMEIGQLEEIHLMPEEAYGEHDPNAVFTVAIADMPGAENVAAGDRVYLQDPMGRPVPALVAAKDEENVTFDCNSEMAGKELNFKIELVEVQ